MTTPLSRPADAYPVIRPAGLSEAADAVRQAAAQGSSLLARGGGTKWSLGALPAAHALVLDTRDLRGITEYEPGELTITAGAGTPLDEVVAALAEHGHYLPFDPPFAASGATLGGTVAAGLSGPRRLRYGGLRDFVIGIRYLNPAGELVRGGGKVVKNAAGYDFPKLFCGSLGTLGLLTEVTFKVFPAPPATQTLLAAFDTSAALQTFLLAVARSKAEISAADAWPGETLGTPLSGAYIAAVQLDGMAASFPPRLKQMQALLPPATPTHLLEADAESALWTTLRDLAWMNPDDSILRCYLPPDRLAALAALLTAERARTVFTIAANAAWSQLPGDPLRLSAGLSTLDVQAAVWRSPTPSPEILPVLPGQTMVKRVKQAFDPAGLFYPGRYAAS